MDLKKLFSNIENDMEFMPIIPLGEVEINDEEKKSLTDELPIIALRNTVLFPNVVLPITVARDKSLLAIEEATKNGGMIGVVAQKESEEDDPTSEEIYHVGTVAKIVKQLKLPDGNTTLFIMGKLRFEVEEFTQEDPFLKGRVAYKDDHYPIDDQEFKALIQTVKDTSEELINLSQSFPPEAAMMVKNIENPSFLVNFISSNLESNLKIKQNLLEVEDTVVRVKELVDILQEDLKVAQLKYEIANKTRGELDKQQREYYLQQQLKSIKDELGGDGNDLEIREFKKRASKKKWPKHAQEAFDKNIERLERMHTQSPEYSINYNYVDLLLDLPWEEYTKDSYDLNKVLKTLDKDHYGMEKIKERILEYLAVLKLKGDLKSPILCFVGPPGIGKTSLGQSIARAINRKFTRLSLGGLHDESELRGHRKTYIGAMPGRIIQSIRKAETSNPVFILDEIDKMGKDFRGDPGSALLEILDPEQNHTFYDNYLELEYDLSKVLFIATANSLADIQPALRDRLEIIDLSGYSVEEKIEIARRHLIKKQEKANGVEGKKIRFNKSSLNFLIHHYTRESGVRELDRKIAAVYRFLAKKIAMDEEYPTSITQKVIEEALGKPIFQHEKYLNNLPAGVAVGLAWTYVGGDILFIESNQSIGKGKLTLTGNLGNVMKESAQTALSYLRANAKKFKIDEELFAKTDIHIHVPEGAVPKDGPSAGVTMLSTLASVLTGKKVKPYLAMSGEITLRGQVLPVGGIKEKVLAAKRAGLKIIMLCDVNKKDVEEIDEEHIKGIEFIYVSQMDEVLKHALDY